MIVAVCVLAAVVVALLVERHAAERAWSAERRRLVNVAISRHAGDVAIFDQLDKTKPKDPDAERPHPSEAEMIGVNGN